MKTTLVWLFHLAFVLLSSAPGQSNSMPVRRAEAAISANDQARFLAGLPVTGPLEPLTRTAAWRDHAASFNAAWQTMEERQLRRVRAWAGVVPSASTLYYFFSGPDFLYADAIFPSASTYVLCAIEPVGQIGDLSRLDEGRLAGSLASLRQSLNTMLRFHYFITKELRTDLSHDVFNGTLPLLYVFLARTGQTIETARLTSNGARINFRTPSGASKTLHYFRTDLSNGGNNGAFFNFCGQFSGAGALLKSASYLLQDDNYSRCRQFLLQHSRVIVQDDSGIPYRAFPPEQWNIRLFGNYAGTEGIFTRRGQPDLLSAYRQITPAPLGFAFGYHSEPNKGVLMIATPR